MTMRVHDRGRRGRGAAALACLLLLLTGCTGSSGLTSDQARTTYDPVLRDVAAAAAAPLGATWTDGTGGGTNLTTEGCRWFTKTLTTELDPTTVPDWDAVIAATTATLAAHGFPPAQRSTLTEGFTGVEAHDEAGARITIQSKGTTNLRVSVPVSGTC